MCAAQTTGFFKRLYPQKKQLIAQAERNTEGRNEVLTVQERLAEATRTAALEEGGAVKKYSDATWRYQGK
jgi:hypothetical protein